MPAIEPRDLFKPLAPNSAIENYQARSTAAKGVFTDEARDELAKAVKQEKPTVVMDKWLMYIDYRSDHVYIVADNGPGLPCGTFNRKDLARRLNSAYRSSF
jgi:hypothetical protein